MDFYYFVSKFCDSRGLGFEVVEKFIDVGVINGAVVLVANLKERSSVAGVETFNFVKSERAIRGSFAVFDAEFLFEVVADSVCPAHMA